MQWYSQFKYLSVYIIQYISQPRHFYTKTILLPILKVERRPEFYVPSIKTTLYFASYSSNLASNDILIVNHFRFYYR